MNTKKMILEALIAEAAFRSSVEVELRNTDRRLGEAIAINNENNHLTAECDALRVSLRKLQERQAQADPKLRELYRAANQFLAEWRRQSRRNAPALLEAELDLRDALHDAFDYCDQIPF